MKRRRKTAKNFFI